MENITDRGYAQAKRVCKDFQIKHLGEYNDLYVQSDILLFRNICLEIYELDPEKFISALD